MGRFSYSVALLFAAQLYLAYYVRCADYNTTCAVMKCNGRNTSNLAVKENCRCDANCTMYNDCCVDVPYKTKPIMTFDCVKFSYMSAGIYVKRSCSRPLYRARCLSSRNYDEQDSRIRLKVPVTGASGITYGNQYCASCSKENDYKTWNISVECDSGTRIMSLRNFTLKAAYVVTPKEYIFNTTTQLWNYVDENNKTENCTLHPYPPIGFRRSSSVRKCYSKMVQTCSSTASDDLANKCANYTSVVTDYNGTAYKNEYCALCNNVSSSSLRCRRTTSFTFRFPRRSTRPMYSTSNEESLTSSPTSTTRTTRTTSTTSTTSTSFVLKSTTSSAAANNNTANSSVVTREFLHIYVMRNCQDFVNSMTLTKTIVETKSISTIKRARVKGIVPISDTPVRFCQEPSTEDLEVMDEQSVALKFAVNSAVLASAVFILLHLYDFFFTTFAATLTQKSTASYAIALAIGNVGFFASNAVSENLCHLLGAITYFGFLTSFFWLSALAFDISCKVWSCVQEFDMLGKNFTNSQKFTAYSLISWIFPPVAIFIMTYVAARNDDFIIVGRVYETCWFQSDQTLLLFFVFPLTITMSVNAAFYMFSVYVVWVERSATDKLFAKYAINFKFHTALIVISNLMWSVALVAMYYDSSILWLCFAILDAVLGLIVYISSPVKHEISTKITTFVEKFTSSSHRNDVQS